MSRGKIARGNFNESHLLIFLQNGTLTLMSTL